MPDLHSLAHIDRIRALLTVIEEGSVNRAAVRLRITQPALSRQMQSLEKEIGGRLLERETSGVKPTGLGHSLVKSMKPLLEDYEAAMADLRRLARGERSELRVGYLMSAAQSILTPALALLRQSQPKLKLKLHDMSPREQIDGLRAGELDVALIRRAWSPQRIGGRNCARWACRFTVEDALASKKASTSSSSKAATSSAWTKIRCRVAIAG